ncbi:MAG: 50S ribosomal protein L25/general stress protein Ctc [Betaproteobacteria bacterium]|nr:50S ribosomal protein L25/general stress protein Ctc [Betaproteobacteria bacterium]
MQIEFEASKREEQGTGASRRLRRAGRVPGIVYGGEARPQAVSMDHNGIWQQLRQEAFHSSVLSMKLDGATQPVLLRDVQMHPVRPQILHIDFQRVDATHRIHVKVPLHYINADVCPGVKLQGGIVSHVMTELDVSCLPGDLPEFIEVDLKEMATGHSLHVSGLKLPQGVEPVNKAEDPVVANVLLPKGAAAGEEGAEGAAQ